MSSTTAHGKVLSRIDVNGLMVSKCQLVIKTSPKESVFRIKKKKKKLRKIYSQYPFPARTSDRQITNKSNPQMENFERRVTYKHLTVGGSSRHLVAVRGSPRNVALYCIVTIFFFYKTIYAKCKGKKNKKK